MRKIGKCGGARLEPLAVYILNPCGHAPASRCDTRSFLRPTADTAELLDEVEVDALGDADRDFTDDPIAPPWKGAARRSLSSTSRR